MLNRGNITTEHTVWCARARNVMDALPFRAKSTIGHPCGCVSYLSHAGTAAAAASEARLQGWKLTKDYGWLCPPCANAREDKESKS